MIKERIYKDICDPQKEYFFKNDERKFNNRIYDYEDILDDEDEEI